MLRSSSNQGFARADAVANGTALEIQTALAALAQIETRHRMNLEALVKWPGPEALKERFVNQLEAHHAREREPIVQLLAELHQRMTMASMFRDLSRVH